MKKSQILIFLSLVTFLSNCKSKKALTFEQKYKEADKLYNKKKFRKAAEIYEDLYTEVPNKIDNVKILKKLSDCLYKEKEFKHCFGNYKTLYRTIYDEDRLMHGYRMCNCLFNLSEKNNKRDISQAETLLEMIDSILEEFEDTNDEQEREILKYLQKLKENTCGKIVEKYISFIRTYENLEMFDSAVIYSRNFLLKYPNSEFSSDIYRCLIKNQFLSATGYEQKNKNKMTEEKQNLLFEKWKQIILTFDNYKEKLQDDKASKDFYEQALKKLNLQR